MENNSPRPTYKWIFTLAAACILLCFGAGNLDIIAQALSWLIELVFPLLLGLLLALIFNVIMHPIEKHLFQKTHSKKLKKARRPLAIFLSLLILFGGFTGISLLIIPELINGIRILFHIINGILERFSLPKEALDFSTLPVIGRFTHIDTAVDALRSLLGCLADFFIGIVFSVYLLANKERLRRQLSLLANAWLPHGFVRQTAHILLISSKTFRHFIIGQATEAILLGTLCTLGMWLLRIPYAAIIGSLVGVTALLPMVGAIIGAIVGAFIILTENPLKALVFLIFLILLQQLEGNFIYPKVVGARLHLPAMWVLASILIGGSLAGPIGMLIGVPIAATAYTLLKEATEKRIRLRHK